MKALVTQGFIGQPLGFNVQLLMPLQQRDGRVYPYCAYPEGGVNPYHWLADPASGAGGWRNFGSHTVLFLTHLLGEVEQAVGATRIGVRQWQLPDGTEITPHTEDLGSATLCLKNGAIGNVQTGWCVPDAACLRVEIWGDRGRLLLEDPTFGDGISARLYAAENGRGEFGHPIGRSIDIPAGVVRSTRYTVHEVQLTALHGVDGLDVPRHDSHDSRWRPRLAEFRGGLACASSRRSSDPLAADWSLDARRRSRVKWTNSPCSCERAARKREVECHGQTRALTGTAGTFSPFCLRST